MRRRRVVIDEEVGGYIRHAHPDTRRRLRAALEALADEPYLGKELHDELLGLRSLRVGGLRIVYLAGGSLIRVVGVGPRATIYMELARRKRRQG